MILIVFFSLLTATGILMVALAWWGGRRFARQSEAVAQELLAQATPRAWQTRDLANLPAPVRRYLEQALPPAGEAHALMRATLGGAMRLSPARPWQGWRGVQTWCAYPPGFVWNARLWVSRFAVLHARDALVRSRGNLLVSLWGWFALAKAGGAPELNQGSLQRWLAEAPFFPLALLPSAHLRWEGINETSARVVIKFDGVEAEGVFTFSPRGRPLSFYTPARWQQGGDGKFVATPWQASFGRWRRMEGCLVPTWGQASWLPDGQEFAYIRLVVKKMELI